MLVRLWAQFLIAAAFSLLLTACSQTEGDDSLSLHKITTQYPLQFNTEIDAIVLSGVFVPPQELTLHLATPLLTSPSSSTSERYSVTINDSNEHIAVHASDISKGPLHFKILIGQDYLPIRKLTLYDHNTQLSVIRNKHPLPPQNDWMSQLELKQTQDQLCLTWPDNLFTQAGLLSLSEQGRLQLRKQSSASPLCIDSQVGGQIEWLVNLRNPLFAVQLTTNF